MNQLRFARQLRPAEVLFTQDTTRVYLYLEKIKSNRFDVLLGTDKDKFADRAACSVLRLSINIEE